MSSVSRLKPKLPGRITINSNAISAWFKAGESKLGRDVPKTPRQGGVARQRESMLVSSG